LEIPRSSLRSLTPDLWGKFDFVLVARKGDDGAALGAGALEGEVEDADDDVAEVGPLVDLSDDVENGAEFGERGRIDRNFVSPALWHRPNSILNSPECRLPRYSPNAAFSKQESHTPAPRGSSGKFFIGSTCLATTLQPRAQIGRWIRLPPLPTNVQSLRTAGLVLGLGIGGFLDGIVFHMLLQWHHLICINCGSGPQSPFDLRKEILSDGLFHVVTLGLVVAGVFLLWKAVRRAPALFPPRFLFGAILLGWGIFNLL